MFACDPGEHTQVGGRGINYVMDVGGQGVAGEKG